MQRPFVLLAAALLLTCPEAVRAQGSGMTLTVELGDVSATKLPFVVAAETGIYTRNGLDVRVNDSREAGSNDLLYLQVPKVIIQSVRNGRTVFIFADERDADLPKPGDFIHIELAEML